MTEEQLQTELSRSSVEAAYEAIKSFIHRTPVFTSSSLSTLLASKCTLYFKAENLQKGGAFKFRGASYSLGRLTEAQLRKGVCTHSSGTSIHVASTSIVDTLIFLQETMQVPSLLLPKNAESGVSLLWSVTHVFA